MSKGDETYEKTTSWGKLSPALRDIVDAIEFVEVDGRDEGKKKLSC